MQNYTYEGAMAANTATGIALTQQARTTHTQEQVDNLEKTLSHLAGRVQELRARMDGVLLPLPPAAEGATTNQSQPQPNRSALAERLRGLNIVAGSTISDIEDVLNRLDV